MIVAIHDIVAVITHAATLSPDKTKLWNVWLKGTGITATFTYQMKDLIA